MRILVFLFSFSPIFLQAQPCFTLIPASSVSSISETDTHMWFGTQQDGLYQWNKVSGEVESFTSLNSNIPSDRIHDLLFFGNDIWLSTDSSVLKFDNGEFTSFTSVDRARLAVRSTGLLIVADAQTYREFDGDQMVYSYDLFETEGLHFSCDICETTSHISVSPDGSVWLTHFGFYEFDILHYSDGNWELYDHNDPSADGLPVESFDPRNSILALEQEVLATSWGGLTSFDGAFWTSLHGIDTLGIVSPPDTMYGSPISLAFDHDQGYWTASSYQAFNDITARLAHFDQSSWQLYALPDTTLIHDIWASPFNTQLIYAATEHGLLKIDLDCTVGVTSQIQMKNGLKLYPNPVNDLLTIILPHDILTDYWIADSQGQIVQEGELARQESSIDVSRIKEGQYMLHMVQQEYMYRSPFLVLR
ncbi:MAG: T9SS type A sorting domain-containing protein [Flavobacteriales bacterium]|nr:T9SS type A sorting domain-containing protein [Flavobacteriales bacterium]